MSFEKLRSLLERVSVGPFYRLVEHYESFLYSDAFMIQRLTGAVPPIEDDDADETFATGCHFFAQVVRDHGGRLPEEPTPQDRDGFARAAFLWERAADMDHVEAQHHLAGCYYYGYGVARNVATAREWMHRAVMQRHLPALYAFGEMVLDNHPTSHQEAMAYRLWHIAAERHHYAPALHNYAVALAHGNIPGQDADEPRALVYILDAARQGYTPSVRCVDALRSGDEGATDEG